MKPNLKIYVRCACFCGQNSVCYYHYQTSKACKRSSHPDITSCETQTRRVIAFAPEKASGSPDKLCVCLSVYTSVSQSYISEMFFSSMHQQVGSCPPAAMQAFGNSIAGSTCTTWAPPATAPL